jgi:hypothetical protein
MSVRFRYLAADGCEVGIRTTGELVLAFVSGELQESSLLYDAEGGGWAPARNHSVFLSLELPGAGSKSFTLAESKPLDPKDALAEVLRDREERRPASTPIEGLTSSEGTLAQTQIAPAPSVTEAAHPSGDIPYQTLQATWQAAGSRPLSWLEQPARYDRAKGVLSVGTAALAGFGTSLIVLLLVWNSIGRPSATAQAGAQEPAHAPEATSTALTPGVSAGMSAAEQQAFRDMSREIQRLRGEHRVTRVPSIWLEGRYLAGAQQFPEVREYWVAYSSYVRAVQAAEGELYRRSFVARLERQGVGTSAVSMLLARALRTFEADRARRDAVYASMLEMANTAIELHDLLAAHDSEISFEPASTVVSRDPVVEAVAENPKLAAQMNVLLDRMFVAIERAQGDRVVGRSELPSALEHALIPSEAATR